MELLRLQYIVVSARDGGFSAAANELNIRQTIVSKRIKEVEDEALISQAALSYINQKPDKFLRMDCPQQWSQPGIKQL